MAPPRSISGVSTVHLPGFTTAPAWSPTGDPAGDGVSPPGPACAGPCPGTIRRLTIRDGHCLGTIHSAAVLSRVSATHEGFTGQRPSRSTPLRAQVHPPGFHRLGSKGGPSLLSRGPSRVSRMGRLHGGIHEPTPGPCHGPTTTADPRAHLTHNQLIGLKNKVFHPAKVKTWTSHTQIWVRYH
ncbi:hypothetical protein FNV43_RR08673 [Rhamnella rubrinervis]|uniref:Uncharacterized protein n=1 Tax=Rhamnella rubrinervis TaxID=2594499 RepID=A0A8K0MJ56_9ROSA|nr:hypothetical protein FNV43_RR08673 [Rhamnella rubrinervis]